MVEDFQPVASQTKTQRAAPDFSIPHHDCDFDVSDDDDDDAFRFEDELPPIPSDLCVCSHKINVHLNCVAR